MSIEKLFHFVRVTETNTRIAKKEIRFLKPKKFDWAYAKNESLKYLIILTYRRIQN